MGASKLIDSCEYNRNAMDAAPCKCASIFQKLIDSSVGHCKTWSHFQKNGKNFI